MHIKVSRRNIDEYRLCINKDIKSLKWTAGELDPNVLKNFPNLAKLDCSRNKLKSLEGIENCPQLEHLNCSINNLKSLKGIENCSKLKHLNCSINRLTSLKDIKNCQQLRHLNCSINRLKSLRELKNCLQLQCIDCSDNIFMVLKTDLEKSMLPIMKYFNDGLKSLRGVEKCSRLRYLNCSKNSLTCLQGIEKLLDLRKLDCSSNKITRLTEIGNCTELRILKCSFNRLTSLDGVDNCHYLQQISCSENRLTFLDPIVYLQQLRFIDYDHYLYNYQSIQVRRYLNRISLIKNNTIYLDEQNIHDSTVQKSVCESIKNLLQDPKPDFNIQKIIDSELDQKTKKRLIKYCQDSTIHSIHLLTFQDLFAYVWARITESKNREELMKVLEEQISDSKHKCFIGRFNRILAVLAGFFDDIKIEISDSDRITAIVLSLREKHSDKSIAKQKGIIAKRLTEAGYDKDTIKPWIDVFDDL